jgi:fructose-1,6-bisphosphatase/inositol monophosphatase family enzyme
VSAVTSSAPAPDPGRDEPVVLRARAVLDDALDEVAGWLLDRSGELEVTAKADGTPVTDADREVDDRLRARLQAAFPDHGVLSEERATVAPTTRGRG